MKFNIWFTIRGPNGMFVEAPNKGNPVECDKLSSLLAEVLKRLPENKYTGIETIGIRIEPIQQLIT